MDHANLAPLEYAVSEPTLDPVHKAAVEVEVSDVLGECPTVIAGKKYVVRGKYVCRGRAIARLCLSCHGRNMGQPVEVWDGERKFEVTAIPMDVTSGQERVLNLQMFGKDGRDLGVRLRFDLKKVKPE